MAVSGQSPSWNPYWLGSHPLFVGTSYQPIGRGPEQIKRDVSVMRRTAFN
jgi:hypothetical protein